MKYTSNDNIPKGPGRILKVSHITSQEKVSRLCLYYQPQNFEEPNTLVCTQKAKPLRKENHFLNDNENLAIAGPSRIVSIKMYYLLIARYIFYYPIQIVEF